MRSTRFAHIEGFTDLCHSDNGQFIITCGQDGDIRIFEGLDDDDCKTHNIADSLHAVAFYHNSLLVGSDMNMVHAFTFEEGESNGVVTRFTAPPTHIQLSKDKNLIAAASSDMTIKVHDAENFKDYLLTGHEAPVLSISFDPAGKYLASSSCDGTVKIWSLITHTLVTSMTLLPKYSDFSPCNLCRLTWTSNGKHLIIPMGKELLFYKRDIWEKDFTFKSDKMDEDVSIVTVSPCGSYIAAGGKKGLVAIWDLFLKSCLVAKKHPKKMNITGVSWNPTVQKLLAFVTDAGELGTMSLDVHDELVTKAPDFSSSKVDKDIFPPLETDVTHPGDEDDDADFSIAKIKSQLGFADDELGTYMGLPSSKGGPEDDMSRASSPQTRIVEVPIAPKLPEPQKPFQPGMSPEHLDQRYMLWNDVGIIRQYNTESENSIEVEFHDSSTHYSLHLNNHVGHSMAALSDQALALAAESQSDVPSKLVVDHFASWSTQKEWMTDMPEGEDILALGIGQSWVAAATDKRNLRIFSASGIQKNVLAIPGPVVCLAGHKGYIFIVFHSGIGVGGEQSMSAMVLDLASGSHLLPQPAPLPLSPNSFLSWIGFSDEGSPLMMDSAGVIRMLQSKLGVSWAVLLDTKSLTKGKSDHYFLLGASELQSTARCILCRGSRYPSFLPRPHVSLLEFKVPMCEPGCEKSELEDKMIQGDLLMNTIARISKQGYDVDVLKLNTERLLKESMIKLFAISSRSEHEFRCYDLCEMMPSYQTVQLAIKYAGKIGRIQLANRLGILAEKKMQEELNLMRQKEEEEIYSDQNSRQDSQIQETEDEAIKSPAEVPIRDNPFLPQTSRRPEMEAQTISPLAPARNPFRRSSSSTAAESTKGIVWLDSLMPPPKKNQGTNDLRRPPLKIPKTKQASLPLKPTLPSTKEVTGKENKESLPSSSVHTATESPKSTPTKTKKSALHLWLQDNKDAVMAKYPGTPDSALVAKAALLFKDADSAVKQKYKQLALKANEMLKEASDSASPSLGKRRLSEGGSDELPDATPAAPPEKKMSFLSKLESYVSTKKE